MNKATELITAIPENRNAEKKKEKLTAVFFLCFLSSTLGGSVSTLMSVYLPVAVKDLVGTMPVDKLNEIGATINSVFIFGWMFGGFAWGAIADRFGRSKGFVFSTACYGIFTLLTALSPNWMWASACRFLSGFGVGGVLVTTTILISELWTEKKRAIVLGILSISIPVGIFSAGLINYLLPSWRQAFAVGILPLLISITAFFYLPESTKWLEGKAGKQNDQLKADLEKNSDYRRNLLAGSLIFGTMLIGLWAVFSWLPTWVQSVLPDKDAQQERGISMMIMGAGGLTGGFISGWIVNAIGLRKSMVLCFVSCFLLSFLLFKVNHLFSVAAYVEIAVLALFFGISQGVLNAYIPALYPTQFRSAATGFSFNIGRIFTASVVFFVGWLVNFLGGYGNALTIFSVVFLLGFIVCLLVKEKRFIQ